AYGNNLPNTDFSVTLPDCFGSSSSPISSVLRYLELGSSGLTSAPLHFRWPQLRILDLSGARLQSFNLADVAFSPQLAYFDVHGIGLTSSLPDLSSMPGLQEMYLSGNSLLGSFTPNTLVRSSLLQVID